MNNIFTFDFEEDDEQQQNSAKTEGLKKDVNPQLSQKTNKQVKVSFNDFEEFEQEKKPPLKNASTTKTQKQTLDKSSDDKENIKISESLNFKKKWKQTKNQTSNPMIVGLEVEDLGMKDMEYVIEKKALKVTDMRKFLFSPLGDYKVKAILKKQPGNIFNIGTKYHIFIEQNNRYLFSVIREGISQYVFSLEKNIISQAKKSYMGKMTANLSGTEFLLFDSGFTTKETRALQFCRKQLASIKYSTNSGPRKFTTIISTNNQGFYCLQDDQNVLEQKWDQKQREYLSILHSKSPELDPTDGNYKLDFKGIVKKPSVKNFILGGVEWDDSLIFGKIDDQSFIMQIKQPLSVFQSAAICISSIHYKLSWK